MANQYQELKRKQDEIIRSYLKATDRIWRLEKILPNRVYENMAESVMKKNDFHYAKEIDYKNSPYYQNTGSIYDYADDKKYLPIHKINTLIIESTLEKLKDPNEKKSFIKDMFYADEYELRGKDSIGYLKDCLKRYEFYDHNYQLNSKNEIGQAIHSSYLDSVKAASCNPIRLNLLEKYIELGENDTVLDTYDFTNKEHCTQYVTNTFLGNILNTKNEEYVKALDRIYCDLLHRVNYDLKEPTDENMLKEVISNTYESFIGVDYKGSKTEEMVHERIDLYKSSIGCIHDMHEISFYNNKEDMIHHLKENIYYKGINGYTCRTDDEELKHTINDIYADEMGEEMEI